ncbi:MAG: S-adenosylmethionine:tRNA ribosyltransferase-isomerase [Bacteroidales bacterium]|nr:S-adenosylmethionine:tRNA ribosyltransferase-isomerase [Bacteroidales bacterium]
MMTVDIDINNYDYSLPEERIAKYPLPNRDDSNLLVNVGEGYSKKCFRDISRYLPENGFMVFNQTKVIPARLFFRRDTGSLIEIFCLEPYEPSDYQICFATTSSCRFKCMVGNLKRFKDRVRLVTDHCDASQRSVLEGLDLTATLVERTDNTCIVEFNWYGGESFSRVMEMCGNMPIPPYLNRETEALDYTRYQTTYARWEGSVAAPTAGLHFTDRVMDSIRSRGIDIDYVTLHVGAGTFLPVKSDNVAEHNMHSEPFVVTLAFLEKLLSHVGSGKLIAVGTTSTRTLESLYYLGVHCIERGAPGVVEQWEPYREQGYDISTKDALSSLIKYLENNNLDKLTARTRLIIVPGFKYRMADYLVTNFHQPKSTLLLLIAAFIGDQWRDMYRFAMDNGFRFLSYGDSSLLTRC